MIGLIDFLNTIFWGYVLIYGLLAVGIFFTVRLRFQQIRRFPEMFRLVLHAPASDKEGISPFQALCTSLASRVGTGNIAGVAVALNLGGPGAIFWMWMVALVGMATAYSESTLAQLYKTHGPGGVYRGGPAFYIARGLGIPWLGAIFAACLILSFGLVFNAVQANSIADAMEGAFGLPKLATGLVLAGLSAVVGYVLGMSIALAVIQWSKGSSLPMVMTPTLAFWLFVLTVAMCAISAISAIVKVTKIDPATVFSR